MPAPPRHAYTLESFVREHLAYELVEDEAAFRRELERLLTDRPDAVAVDLEYTMHPEHDRRRVRLVQVGVPGRQLLVDAQRVDARPLRDLFADERVEKLLHAASGDYEQWLRYVRPAPDDVERWLFRNVVDTLTRLTALNGAIGRLPEGRRREVAAAAGLELPDGGPLLPLSVSDLTEHVLGFSFGRSHRHRWGQPVLTEGQLRYAALDVAVMPFIAEWVHAVAAAAGVDAAAAAADEDRRNVELAADLALVPVTRRRALDELVKDAWRSAARRDGTHELPALAGAERRYLLRRYSKRRGRSTVREEEGGALVAVTISWRRQRELMALAHRAPVDVDLRDEQEERFLADYLSRKRPDLALEGARVVPRA